MSQDMPTVFHGAIMLKQLHDQKATLLAAAKKAYADAVLPQSRSARELLAAIRCVEPDFPEREYATRAAWPTKGASR